MYTSGYTFLTIFLIKCQLLQFLPLKTLLSSPIWNHCQFVLKGFVSLACKLISYEIIYLDLSIRILEISLLMEKELRAKTQIKQKFI